MKSHKQRRTEITARRAKRDAKTSLLNKKEESQALPTGCAPCNPSLLAPNNSYGAPPFVQRGYYVDMSFECCDCRKQEVWRATQQKWWYEVAKGSVESRAIRCRHCRRVERERKTEARRVHQNGLEKKRALQRKV